MSTDRDDAPSTPPPGIRSGQMPEPVSGFREERVERVEPVPSVNDTELSITGLSGPNPDTLMSLPKPLPHDELPYETRLRQLEDRVETLQTRLDQVQRGSISASASKVTPWWFWVLFMVGLAITWRVLGMLR